MDSTTQLITAINQGNLQAIKQWIRTKRNHKPLTSPTPDTQGKSIELRPATYANLLAIGAKLPPDIGALFTKPALEHHNIPSKPEHAHAPMDSRHMVDYNASPDLGAINTMIDHIDTIAQILSRAEAAQVAAEKAAKAKTDAE